MGIVATLGELGPVGFLSYAASRLLGPRWLRYRLIAVPVSAMPAMPRGHVARAMEPAEIGAHAAVLELPDAAIRHRLGQGMTCLGVWRGERLLGVNWVTAGAFDEDEAPLRFVPPPGCGWDTGLYLRSEDRGGRAFAALWAATAGWLTDRGLGWSMSRITDHNVGSWRSHQRMGGVPIGTVAILGAGERGLLWWHGLRTAPATIALPVPA